jgi:hypothetical protein
MSTTGMFDSATTAKRAVPGMCGSGENSIATMGSASDAGITSVETCAAYARDLNENGAKFKAAYISYTKSGNKCAWFSECGCLAASSTCSGGDLWVSVSIRDVFVDPGPSIMTVQQTVSPKSAQIPSNAAEGTTTGDRAQCDETSTDLMKTFQTQCQMTQSITFTRMVAGIILGIVLVVVGIIFGFAYWLDGKEQASLVGAR